MATSLTPTMLSPNCHSSSGPSPTPPAYHPLPVSGVQHSSHLFQGHTPLQMLPESTFHDYSSSFIQPESVVSEIKPFSLPSLASITANLAASGPSTDQSHVGPHRGSHSFSVASGRRFSPLGNSPECSDVVSPLDGERSGISVGERRPSTSGINMMIAGGHRPRSRSLLSGHSMTGTATESEAPIDESASDSGGSDKKRDNEDGEHSAAAKKRSRTLTTPSQQRRLMQILEQTRFPSTELREQLARELGMTPRRVQIWFQNRRQGMKKALEQRAEQEAAAASTADFNRTRGYSFGAYPTPPSEHYAQQGLHPSQTYGGPGMRIYTTGPGAPASGGFEAFGGQQLYAPRTLTRTSMPRSLPQLELAAKQSPGLQESGGTVPEFPWSESSGASTAYSLSSVPEREKMFPPLPPRTQSHAYDGTGLTTFAQPQPQQPLNMTRHRSQTNPDFFGIMNGFGGLSGLGALAQDNEVPFQTGGGTPIQRFVAQSNECLGPKAEPWGANYNQAGWQEEMGSLKLDPAAYGTDLVSQHVGMSSDPFYVHPAGAAQQSTDLYHAEGSHGGCTFQMAPVGQGANPYEYPTLEHNHSTSSAAAAQHHARQRSRSLHA